MRPRVVTLFGSSHRATAPGGSGGMGFGVFSYPKVPSVMTSASSKPFFHVPHDDFCEPLRPQDRGHPGVTTLPGSSSYNWGAPGFERLLYIEDRGQDFIFHVDKTEGLFGYLSRLSAATRATASPTYRTFGQGGAMQRGVPPFKSGTSSQVSTAFTPFSLSALLPSTLLMTACGWGLRSTFPWRKSANLIA